MATHRRAEIERSAGGVVVRTVGGVHHVLLIRDPYKNWGLPKGHIEEAEAPASAALREVREETGLQELTLGPSLGTIDWRFRLGRRLIHKYCQFFLMASTQGSTQPEAEEGITECRWVPVPEALSNVTYDNAREMIRNASELLVREVDETIFPPWRA